MIGGDGARRLSRRNVLTTGLGAVAFGLAGCVVENDAPSGNPPSTGERELSAVAGSFFMLYDLARNVAGDGLHVEDLVPTGTHGDDWEPGPGILEDVSRSDVFVYIEGFRRWSDDVAASLPLDYPDVVVIDAAEGIEYIAGEAGREVDPHFWMDPLLAAEAVENIRDGFVEADPANASVYEENAASFLDRLDDVHARFGAAMERRRRDVIVIGSHDSFQYWRPRYELDIYSPVGISPDSEPTAREMQAVVDIVEEHDLGYILYDKYEPRRYAESLAAETGTELLPLSPIEATSEEELEAGMGYVEHMLDVNLETLELALEVDHGA